MNILGNNLIANSQFDDETGWSVGNGWTISNGKAHFFWAGNSLTFRTLPQGAPSSLDAGKTYLITYTLSNMAMQMDAAGVCVRFDGKSGELHTQDQDGTFSDEFVYEGHDPYVGFYVYGVETGPSSFDLDDIYLQELERVPVIEAIARAIEGLVNQITVVNGYCQTLTAVRPKRVHFWDEITADNTVLISQGKPERMDMTHATIDWRQPFELQAICIDSDAATETIESRLNKVRSDIEKKLMADVTLGGLSYDLQIQPPDYYSGDRFTGIAVNVDVLYRTLLSDPYSLA